MITVKHAHITRNVKQNTKEVFQFELRNTSNKDIEVTAQAGCGCTMLDKSFTIKGNSSYLSEVTLSVGQQWKDTVSKAVTYKTPKDNANFSLRALMTVNVV